MPGNFRDAGRAQLAVRVRNGMAALVQLDAPKPGEFPVPDTYQPGCNSPAEQPFDSLCHPSSRFAGSDDVDVSKCVKAISMSTSEQALAAYLQMALNRFAGNR